MKVELFPLAFMISLIDCHHARLIKSMIIWLRYFQKYNGACFRTMTSEAHLKVAGNLLNSWEVLHLKALSCIDWPVKPGGWLLQASMARWRSSLTDDKNTSKAWPSCTVHFCLSSCASGLSSIFVPACVIYFHPLSSMCHFSLDGVGAQNGERTCLVFQSSTNWL